MNQRNINARVGSSIGGKSSRSGELLAQKLLVEGIQNQQVLQAIARSPRHIFVPEILAHKAYDNTALPIGQGQTISQPYIVAKMSELLLADGVPESILEIGTGSGYQTSILGQIIPKVFSVEPENSNFELFEKDQEITSSTILFHTFVLFRHCSRAATPNWNRKTPTQLFN